MKKIAIIPARYDSSRLPGKPLRIIKGKPLIQHVYERVLQARNLDATYITTDDKRIQKFCKSINAEVIMTSNAAKSGSDRVAFAATELGLQDDDIIVNIQGDQPLINPQSITDILSLYHLQHSKEFDMATLAYKIVDIKEITNPKDVKMVIDNNNMALYFSRAAIPYGRDQEHKHYLKHLGVYAYTTDFLQKFISLPLGILEDLEKLEQLRVLENGYKIKVFITKFDSLEVDELEDLNKITNML